MKKLLVVGLIVGLLVVGLMVTSASAWFEDTEKIQVTGKTGSVNIDINTILIALPSDIAPGYVDTCQVILTNSGDCKVIMTVTLNAPTFLKVTVSPGTGTLVPKGGTVTFDITFEMLSSQGNPEQGKEIAFTITFHARNQYF